MRVRFLNGLLTVDILTILLILAVLFIPSNAVRVVIGLPFLLFFPGYTLLSAVLVKREGTDGIEKIALSVGLSVAIVALIGLGLNYTAWGIRVEPVLYTIAVFIFIMSDIALIRQAVVFRRVNFTSEFILRLSARESSPFSKSLSIILIISIVAALGALGYTIAFPPPGETFTEFYILGLNNKAQDYPAEFSLAQGQVTRVVYDNGTEDASSGLGKIILGIINREKQAATYYVTLKIDNEPVAPVVNGQTMEQIGPISLQHGEKWESEVDFSPRHTGERQKVEFLLFKGDTSSIYNSLHLWINVRE